MKLKVRFKLDGKIVEYQVLEQPEWTRRNFEIEKFDYTIKSVDAPEINDKELYLRGGYRGGRDNAICQFKYKSSEDARKAVEAFADLVEEIGGEAIVIDETETSKEDPIHVELKEMKERIEEILKKLEGEK